MVFAKKKQLDNSALQQEKGWATEGGILVLYWYSAILIVNSAINGYDGSMMNVSSVDGYVAFVSSVELKLPDL
jgi:hypothetical protein